MEEKNNKIKVLDTLSYDGMLVVDYGRKTLAKIYDREKYFSFNNTDGSYSKKYPYSLELGFGIRECQTLIEAIFLLYRYTSIQLYLNDNNKYTI